MAARPTWKGYLKISLVNIPVKVFPATDASATISFNQLHAECQSRIQQKRWCPTCQKDVPNTDIVKGYEYEKGRYVVMDDEDVEKVRVESTRVIDLEKFTDDVEVDPIYLDKSYYVAPDKAGLVLLSLILVAAVANLNLSVANVALPDIGAALAPTPVGDGGGRGIALRGVLVIVGRLGDLCGFGSRRRRKLGTRKGEYRFWHVWVGEHQGGIG